MSLPAGMMMMPPPPPIDGGASAERLFTIYAKQRRRVPQAAARKACADAGNDEAMCAFVGDGKICSITGERNMCTFNEDALSVKRVSARKLRKTVGGGGNVNMIAELENKQMLSPWRQFAAKYASHLQTLKVEILFAHPALGGCSVTATLPLGRKIGALNITAHCGEDSLLHLRGPDGADVEAMIPVKDYVLGALDKDSTVVIGVLAPSDEDNTGNMGMFAVMPPSAVLDVLIGLSGDDTSPAMPAKEQLDAIYTVASQSMNMGVVDEEGIVVATNAALYPGLETMHTHLTSNPLPIPELQTEQLAKLESIQYPNAEVDDFLAEVESKLMGGDTEA